jgi:hypothetical protein
MVTRSLSLKKPIWDLLKVYYRNIDPRSKLEYQKLTESERINIGHGHEKYLKEFDVEDEKVKKVGVCDKKVGVCDMCGRTI